MFFTVCKVGGIDSTNLAFSVFFSEVDRRESLSNDEEELWRRTAPEDDYLEVLNSQLCLQVLTSLRAAIVS